MNPYSGIWIETEYDFDGEYYDVVNGFGDVLFSTSDLDQAQEYINAA